MGTRNDHGTTACYKSGCRCDDCKDAKAADRARRAYEKSLANAPDYPVVSSINVSVGCIKCGSPLYLLVDGKPSRSGAYKAMSFKCADRKCGIGQVVTMSHQTLGAQEFMGAM